MKKYFFLFLTIVFPAILFSQNTLTPELLWNLHRVNAIGISKDKQYIIYSVATPNIEQNKNITKTYRIPVDGGSAEEITNADSLVANTHISPDG
ncbi:MAG TPA: S9 family peptidase, partial [Parafilimonas sp.]|nr:S9 family peptidase [Parafilimonas sp.]